MLPQRQLRAPCVGVLPPGNGVRGFHQRSGGAGVTLLNASPATSLLLSLLCSIWVNSPCPSCAAQLSPPPGRRPRGSCSAFVVLPSSLSPMSLGSWPWLGSSLSLVPCCPLRAEPASVPVLCAGDEGCTRSVSGSRPPSVIPSRGRRTRHAAVRTRHALPCFLELWRVVTRVPLLFLEA